MHHFCYSLWWNLNLIFHKDRHRHCAQFLFTVLWKLNYWFFDKFLKMSIFQICVTNVHLLLQFEMEFEFNILLGYLQPLCTIPLHSFVSRCQFLIYWFLLFRDKSTSSATVCNVFWIWYFIRLGLCVVDNSSSQFVKFDLHWMLGIFLKT